MIDPLCHACPLNYQTPGLSLQHPSKYAVVGEAPGYSEEILKQYFVGESGKLLRGSLNLLDLPDPHINNALRCRAPKNLSPRDWKQALACCQDRLISELHESGATHILAAGMKAFHALTTQTKSKSHFPWLGAPIESNWDPLITIIPTIHPSFILQDNAQYLSIFRIHLQRTYNLAYGIEEPFQWGELFYYGKSTEETIKALERILNSPPGTLIGLDIETAGKDPLRVPLTAVGVATKNIAVSIAFPIETHFEHSGDRKRALTLLKRILAKKDLPKIAHNGIHDLLGLEKRGFKVRGFLHDSLPMHHVAGPTLLHNLGFVAQTQLGCDPWKINFKVAGDEKGLARFLNASRKELTEYNAKDTQVLPLLYPILASRLDQTHNGWEIYKGYMQRSFIALEMRRNGAKINPKAVRRHRKNLTRNIKLANQRIYDAVQALDQTQAYRVDFDWKNRQDVLGFLCVHHGQPIKLPTTVDKLKLTNKNIVSIQKQLKGSAHEAVTLYLELKAKKKEPKETLEPIEEKLNALIGEFTDSYAFKNNFNPGSNGHLKYLFFQIFNVFPTSYSQKTGAPSLGAKQLKTLTRHEDPKVRLFSNLVLRYRRYTKLYGTYIKRLISKHIVNGYIYPSPKVWGARTGRWAYEEPAIQQMPKKLRDIIEAEPGSYILEADYQQLELRIIATLAQDEKLLDKLNSGEDFHSLNCIDLFGTVGETKDEKSKLRTLSKAFIYACHYGASAETIWNNLAPTFPFLTISYIQRLLDVWFMTHAPIRFWQDRIYRFAKKHDYTELPISGKWIYHHGIVEPQKCYNYPVQGTGADLIDGAIPAVHKALKRTGDRLLFQVHDALIIVTKNPTRAAKILNKHMARDVEIYGKKTRFPVDFKLGRDWGSGIECKTIDQVDAAWKRLEEENDE